MDKQQQTHVINVLCGEVRKHRLKKMAQYKKQLYQMTEDQLREEFHKVMEKLNENQSTVSSR